jgi:acyl carrier protein
MEIRDRLIALVTAILGSATSVPEPFPMDRQLSDLGVSSMKMVNLMLSVEAQFDITIPQDDITPENFQSIDSIAGLVGKILRGSAQKGAEGAPLSHRTPS